MSRCILVVDDDPLIRRLVSTTLEDVAGFDLVEAADGEEALTVAAESPPAIVFLDVDMPRLDGIEVCRRLREPGGPGEHATIVMLTASDEDTTSRRAEDAGADLFLTKPFSPLELLQLVDRIGAAHRD